MVGTYPDQASTKPECERQVGMTNSSLVTIDHPVAAVQNEAKNPLPVRRFYVRRNSLETSDKSIRFLAQWYKCVVRIPVNRGFGTDLFK